MAFVEDDLRGHILWGPTERPGLLATSDLFGETKIHLETPRRLATLRHGVRPRRAGLTSLM